MANMSRAKMRAERAIKAFQSAMEETEQVYMESGRNYGKSLYGKLKDLMPAFNEMMDAVGSEMKFLL